MKRSDATRTSGGLWLVRSLFVICALLMTAGAARADGLRWSITSFHTRLEVQSDGSIDVTERIVADFSREPHRGILRDIPYSYRRSGTDFRLRLDMRGVSDDQGQPHRYSSTRSGGMLHLRIGDPNRTLRGEVVYRIQYTVRRGLLGFDTHDELYWNATGTQWPVLIENATCEVVLPKAALESKEQIRTASFIGPYGSTAAGPAATIGDDATIRFAAPDSLGPWTGMTIVVGFPKGHVAAATRSTRFGWFLADNAILLAPVIVFLLLLALWRFFGRDRGEAGSVAVQYEPPDGLTPIEVGAIIDERVDTRDVTATIFDLAVRGYLTMRVPRSRSTGRPLNSKLKVIRTSKNEDDLKDFEKAILKRLFESGNEVKIESLEAKFYPTLHKVRSQVYRRMNREGYFAGHFPLVRGVWFGLGVLAAGLTVMTAFVLGALDVFAPLSTIIAAALTAPQFPIVAWFMPRKTARGRATLERIKGLEEYIVRAELPTLELAAQQAQFERLLPYAMALDLSDVWARRFEDLYQQPPEWYQMDGSAEPLPTWMLVSHLNSASLTMSHSLSAMPRTESSGSSGGGSSWSSGGFGGGSSGFSGGSSGGGGGGGGGGAW